MLQESSRIAVGRRRTLAALVGFVVALVPVLSSPHPVLASGQPVTAFGGDPHGEIALATSNGLTPSHISNLSNVTAVAGGGSHALALKADGTVWSWGSNAAGQLGAGGGGTQLRPIQVCDTGQTSPCSAWLSGVTAIAAGLDFSVALKSNGTVWTWGHNTSGQLGDTTQITENAPVEVCANGQTSKPCSAFLTGVTAIAAADGMVMALKSDGSVWTWGDNAYDQLGDTTGQGRKAPVQVCAVGQTSNPCSAFLSGVIAVTARGTHAAALIGPSPGTVVGWGDNHDGDVGNGTTTMAPAPVAVTGLSGVTAIACGYNFTLSLQSDGTMRSWGHNGDGELGNGTTTNSTTAVTVTGISTAVAIAGGYAQSLALKSDGTLSSWGLNDVGQLGNGTLTPATSPASVSGLTVNAASSLSVGYAFGLVRNTDGTVWVWGNNTDGEMANGTASARSIPAGVSGISSLTGVSASVDGSFALALTATGTVDAWGYNSSGQVGNGTTTQSLSPVAVTGPTSVVGIAAGATHGMAVTSGGAVWAWGANGSGELGDGTTTQHLSAVQLTTISGVTQVAAGSQFTVALKSDGTVWSWGRNVVGQLGDGSTTQRHSPVQVCATTGTYPCTAFLTGITAITAGNDFAEAVGAGGAVYAWGHDTTSQLGNGNDPANYEAIPVQVCSSTGTYPCTSFLTGITAVSAGDGHSLALTSTGTVWGWGTAGYGQLGSGPCNGCSSSNIPIQVNGVSGATAVSAGYHYSLALVASGVVDGWGENADGQLGVGTTLDTTTPTAVPNMSGVTAISAGDRFTLLVGAPPCAGGSLSLTPPASVSFPSSTLNGLDRTVSASAALTVTDMTSSGNGWSVSGTSTTFTDAASQTLPTTATQVTAASVSAGSPNCSLPTSIVSYPVVLPAGASPPTAALLYDAETSTGGGTATVTLTLQLVVPANSYAGTYTSTMTFSITSGP